MEWIVGTVSSEDGQIIVKRKVFTGSKKEAIQHLFKILTPTRKSLKEDDVPDEEIDVILADAKNNICEVKEIGIEDLDLEYDLAVYDQDNMLYSWALKKK